MAGRKSAERPPRFRTARGCHKAVEARIWRGVPRNRGSEQDGGLYAGEEYELPGYSPRLPKRELAWATLLHRC